MAQGQCAQRSAMCAAVGAPPPRHRHAVGVIDGDRDGCPVLRDGWWLFRGRTLAAAPASLRPAPHNKGSAVGRGRPQFWSGFLSLLG